MSQSRRFNEQEIAEIFKEAAAYQKSHQSIPPHNGGLSIEELEQIGTEAGIKPEFIIKAADNLDREISTPDPRTIFRLPISVARTVDLPEPLSEENWNQFVGELRDSFQATGDLKLDGLRKQWRNGNLHVLIEPFNLGHRLRLQTLNTNLRNMLVGGLVFFSLNLGFLLIGIISGKFGMNPDTYFLGFLSSLGLGAMGYAAIRLIKWGKKRALQMEYLAKRAVELCGKKRVTYDQTSDHQIQIDKEPPNNSSTNQNPNKQSKTRN